MSSQSPITVERSSLSGDANVPYPSSLPEQLLRTGSSNAANNGTDKHRPSSASITHSGEIRPRRSVTSARMSGRSSNSSLSLVAQELAQDIALADATFDPSDLLQEGLEQWHDRSISLQLLKKSRSLLLSRQPSVATQTSSSGRLCRFHDVQDGGSFSDGLRHRNSSRRSDSSILDTTTVADKEGDPLDLSQNYRSTLAVAPHAMLVHVVLLYHKALLKNGLVDEAKKIADVLSQLEAAEKQEMETQLSGMDLLLKDGLLKYMQRVHPHLPPIPAQVVKFKNVTYSTTLMRDTGYESLYTKALECLKGPLKESKIRRVTVLKGVTGYIMPGSLTLVLGPPGCGRSALHSVIAGRLQSPGSSFQGSVTYNGKNVKEIKHRRLAAVVGPTDIHLAPLTVRETLEFSRDCTQAYRARHYPDELKELAEETLRAGLDLKIEFNLSMMGLKRVSNRPVGSPLMPSLTENEKHRLSVAEMLAGTYAIYLFDQLNNGLDDSLTFDLVTGVRIFARVRGVSVVISLIQPSSDVFDLFDRIIMLDRGHILYQGPREDALPYFESLGYVKPKHVGVGEFLEEVTTSEGLKYLQPGFSRLDLDGFLSAYKSSDIYKDICRVVDDPEVHQEFWVKGTHPLGVSFLQPNNGENVIEPVSTVVSSISEKGGSLLESSMDHTCKVQPGDEVVAIGSPTDMLKYIKINQSKGGLILDESQEAVRLQLERPLLEVKDQLIDKQFSRDYVQDPWTEFKHLLKRELQITWRNKLFLYIRSAQVLVLSFFVGFLFFRVKNDADQQDMNLVRGIFFVSLLDMTLFNVGQLPALMEQRATYYKQQSANFFRPGSYLFSKIIGSLPFSLAEATAWTIIVYFLTGLTVKEGGWHFWVFYIIVVLTVLNGAAMVRFISSIAPDLVAASSTIGLVVSVIILFAGFLVPRFKVPKYWLWAYYINPLQWGVTALVINEYNSKSYSLLCRDVSNLANIPQCIGRPNDTIGHAYLAKGQFYTSHHWIGIAVAVLLGWLALLTTLTYFALAQIRHMPKTRLTPRIEARIFSEGNLIVDEELAKDSKRLSQVPIPVTLSWHELSYDILITSIGKTHNILSYISGWAEPGDMVAILGCTGAGKTTLLNCLAGRKVALGREAVETSVSLQFGKKLPWKARSEFVKEILDIADLKHSKKMLLASIGQSISRAEAMRIGIAVELGRNPSILFLDEPTKSLDSRASSLLMKSLQHIADTGRVVIATLPTPSQKILSAFSRVQILKNGGETVYFGPVGNGGDLIREYFEAIPGTPLCPPNVNVGKFAIDVIGNGVVDRKALKDYALEYRVSDLALRNHMQLQRLRHSKGTLGPELVDQGYGATFTAMGLEIFKKMQLYYWRNVNYTWGRIVSSVLSGLLMGSVYFNVNEHSSAGMNTRALSIFISCVLLAISNANSVIPQVVIQRQSHDREKATRQYSLLLYNISFTLAEVPYLMLSTLIFSFIFLLMAQMAIGNAADFFLYWFILFLMTMAITFFGMLLAAVGLLPQIAATLVTIFVGMWVATAGAVVPKKKILHQFLGIFWTNPLQYAINSLTSIAFYCDTEKPECLNNGLNASCLNDPSACPQCNCPRLYDSNNIFVWTQLKFAKSLNHARIPYDILALLVFVIFFRVMTFAIWNYNETKRRR
ncbi:hypothetical protein O6H91_18G028200 [Diphasiastrum complanatum]|uniref:Uncharacterized protein n=1 Tax=Diphasiastrum complanatum TaxID=34168 RepID=A0ACC2B0E9_DIPCM|nr:hypothetical protein O6H91_18G028200 [Diphasiastrum complanatum]